MSRMKQLILVALLAGCAPKVAPVIVRDEAKQVYSIAGFDQSRIAGNWVQVAGFGAKCTSGALHVGPVVSYNLCVGAGRAIGVAEPTDDPGRYTTPDGDLWVLWADADNRTLVIGGPDGKIGAILNRDDLISPDRMKAARDILAFNGYDVSKLVDY